MAAGSLNDLTQVVCPPTQEPIAVVNHDNGPTLLSDSPDLRNVLERILLLLRDANEGNEMLEDRL